jgi:hypothetical protein
MQTHRAIGKSGFSDFCFLRCERRALEGRPWTLPGLHHIGPTSASSRPRVSAKHAQDLLTRTVAGVAYKVYMLRRSFLDILGQVMDGLTSAL